MKYEKAKQALTKLGVKFLTETELKSLCKADTYFYPYGCLHCAKARGKSDFTDILYVEFSKSPNYKKISHWAQEHGSGVGGGGECSYTIIARCRFCGHSDIFVEVE
ncbi:unnamed protein product [marine sediment metagenome]|jgi:hypothetical protein|uniref:Uncharacterized protein n=1 Tax=marine sediment metagenome TaxID=412755 RepID=X1PUF1_9ZZZZ